MDNMTEQTQTVYHTCGPRNREQALAYVADRYDSLGAGVLDAITMSVMPPDAHPSEPSTVCIKVTMPRWVSGLSAIDTKKRLLR